MAVGIHQKRDVLNVLRACRFCILLGIGLSQGIVLGQLIAVALEISGAGIIFTAFAGAIQSE